MTLGEDSDHIILYSNPHSCRKTKFPFHTDMPAPIMLTILSINIIYTGSKVWYKIYEILLNWRENIVSIVVFLTTLLIIRKYVPTAELLIGTIKWNVLNNMFSNIYKMRKKQIQIHKYRIPRYLIMKYENKTNNYLQYILYFMQRMKH